VRFGGGTEPKGTQVGSLKNCDKPAAWAI